MPAYLRLRERPGTRPLVHSPLPEGAQALIETLRLVTLRSQDGVGTFHSCGALNSGNATFVKDELTVTYVNGDNGRISQITYVWCVALHTVYGVWCML